MNNLHKIILFHGLRICITLSLAGVAYSSYDMHTALLCLCIVPCALYCLQAKPKLTHPGYTSITRRVADDPNLLARKRKQILEELSVLESARSLQGTVFEASTELVGITDEKDARERFKSTLNIYWSADSLDLFVWERGSWVSMGGAAFGEEPMLTGPVQLPDALESGGEDCEDTEQNDLVLDLSPGVDGQAALVLHNARMQPTISERSTSDQRYIAEVLRGQLALSLRRVKLYQHLKELGRVDPLTTLYRRWYGIKRLDELLKKNDSLSVAMVDIDWFKKINDSYGHQAGDKVLNVIGVLLAQTLRTGDICCRYGGEEFLVLLPNASSIAAKDVCERIRAKVASLADLPCTVTVSIGVSAYKSGDTHSSITERADTALYEAKERGRNQVVLAEDPHDIHSTRIIRR